MFRGQFIHKISQTGRVSIPSKFRDNLKLKHKTSSLILSSFENSLICYPLPEWEKLESKISSLPQFKKDTVEFERYLIGNAHESEIDNEGRIMIPSILRKHFKISNSAVFVGMLSRFEIWSEKGWRKNLTSSFKKFQKSREVIDGI
jgi:MraZ protein